MFSNKILVRFLKSTRPISAFQIHSTASIMSAKIALVSTVYKNKYVKLNQM